MLLVKLHTVEEKNLCSCVLLNSSFQCTHLNNVSLLSDAQLHLYHLSVGSQRRHKEKNTSLKFSDPKQTWLLLC